FSGEYNAQITYSTSSFAGPPQLSYRIKEHQGTANGDEIRTLDGEIGTVVTVTLTQTPDRDSLTLSLLVPTVNLMGSDQPVNTIALLTTHRTGSGGPQLVKGAVQSYEVLMLQGTARHVDF